MSYASVGFSRLRNTYREIKTYQEVSRFLLSFFLFSDAISTVIFYAAVFGRTVYGFSPELTLVFFAVTQLSAIPGAFIFGYIVDRIGTKNTLIITLILWILVLIVAFFGTDQINWWIVGIIAGVGMGSAQSTARSMYDQFLLEEKKAEMFGLLALAVRFAAIVGPFVFATTLLFAGQLGSDIVTANRYAMLSILGFFVVSILVLLKVRQPAKGVSKTHISE